MFIRLRNLQFFFRIFFRIYFIEEIEVWWYLYEALGTKVGTEFVLQEGWDFCEINGLSVY